MENKDILGEVNGVKIYSFHYLINNQLNDGDLANLLDNNKKGLLYSIIINMFIHVGINKPYNEIIELTYKNKWMNLYTWKYGELTKFENQLSKVLKNIYSYSDNLAKQYAQWYIVLYGFKRVNNTIDL